MKTVTVQCRDCGKDFQRIIQRGRPAIRCESCRENTNPNPIQALKPPVIIAASAQTQIRSASVEEVPERFVVESSVEENSPFRVHVSNLGIAFRGSDHSAAMRAYNHYTAASQRGFGQVGFERVQLLVLNMKENQYEVFKEFIPDRSM